MCIALFHKLFTKFFRLGQKNTMYLLWRVVACHCAGFHTARRMIKAHEEFRVDIFYGVSNDKWVWVYLDHPCKVLGYIPQGNSEERLAKL